MPTNRINPAVDPREVKLQGHRIRMSGMVIVNSLVQTGVLGLFAMAGTIPGSIVAAFFLASTGSALAVFAFTKLGLNLRLKDKNLLIPQLLLHGLVQLGFIVLAPNLAILFLLALFVLFGFGVVQFTPSQFMWGWLLYGASTGLALFLAKDRFAYPGVSGMEIALVWLFFFLALRRFTLSSAQFSHLRNQLSEKNRLLKESLSRIEELAGHDHLTGVLSRGSLIEALEAELNRAFRTGHPFCFAMVDLDHFKEVNDKYGHPVGDAVLKMVSDRAMQSLRVVDRLGRLGGEEFGIVLPATWPDQGMIAMDRLTKAVAECDWASVAPGLVITFSAGITTNAFGDTVETITKRADDALYQAKRDGRNRVVQVEQALPEAQAVDFG